MSSLQRPKKLPFKSGFWIWGGLLGGFGLEFIGFPENAEVGGLAEETLTGLLFLNGPLYLIMYLLAVVFMTMYQIDKKTHQDILAELEAKRAYSAG